MTGEYLVLSGMARFLVEFIRINPRIYFGMSNAQLASLGSVVIGALMIVWARTSAAARPSSLPRRPAHLKLLEIGLSCGQLREETLVCLEGARVHAAAARAHASRDASGAASRGRADTRRRSGACSGGRRRG